MQHLPSCSFPRSAWECGLRRSASLRRRRAPTGGSHAERGNQLLFILVLILLALACAPADDEGVAVPGRDGVTKSTAADRALRRAFDGAPPTIPHRAFGDCVGCHNRDGLSVEGVGFAPPSPHGATTGLSAISRCRQCHVYAASEAVFVDNDFQGLRQDLRRGRRLHELAPPVMPHAVFMRENCQACHAGPAAREEIRTSHPDRIHCRQCHVEQRSTGVFPAGRHNGTHD